MKLWIRNILQNIINKIESEEDKTLPEDYFKDIIKIITIIKMTEEEIQKVWKLYQIHSNSFSCSICKQVLKINTCKNCPIYCQTFNPD